MSQTVQTLTEFIRNQSQSSELDAAAERHPNIPRLIIIKIDAQRRGVHYGERALAAFDPAIHQARALALFGSRDGEVTGKPEALLLRDGTSVLADPTPLDRSPYVVDVVDGRLVLTDAGKIIEEVTYWPKPKYYGKRTTSGVLMEHVVTARPQRFNVFPSSYCHFWTNDKGCQYCDIVNHQKQTLKELKAPARLRGHDIAEVIREGLKETGRFTTICLTAGSDTRGPNAFDTEVGFYEEILDALSELFGGRPFPSQLISSAFDLNQLERLAKRGLTSWTTDLEVLNPRLFAWICPGKEEWVGYARWRQRLIDGVSLFGRGRVASGIVGGVELAKPHGYATEEEALKRTLAEADELGRQGVSVISTVWNPRPGSKFKDQKVPSLDYFIRLAQGLHEVRVRHQLNVDYDDYRRCGNHPDTDLSRVLPDFGNGRTQEVTHD